MATSEEKIAEQRAIVVSEIEKTFRLLTKSGERPLLADFKKAAEGLYQKYSEWMEREDQYTINLGELMSRFLPRSLPQKGRWR